MAAAAVWIARPCYRAVDDLLFAESHYSSGDLARYAAAACGMEDVPGQSVNRHCAASLTAIGNAAAGIGSGMEAAGAASATPSLRPPRAWVTKLVYELRRCGGGIGVAAMCAGGGQGGAAVVEV